VAGLETLLALRALAGDRVDITLVTPDRRFVNRSMSAQAPFDPQRVRGIPLSDVADEFDAHLHHGTVDRIDRAAHTVITRHGEAIGYDIVVVAVGARVDREWRMRGVVTYHGGDDSPSMRLLVHQLGECGFDSVAFVVPDGPAWPSPVYDLALLTAGVCPASQLSLITPEAAPLAIYGSTASAEVRGLLEDAGVTIVLDSSGVPGPDGWLDVEPGHRRLPADRIVTVPQLAGAWVRGIPSGSGGFVETDPHGRVAGLKDVYAAGDVTSFPVKQGGIAAQQADAVAESIAASVGVDLEPKPFRPVLRGTLLTGDRPRYLRADVSGDEVAGVVSDSPLWSPPTKLAGRFLGPYLSSRVGSEADVMPCEDPITRLGRWDYGELSDLGPALTQP
jgi:sulfide:quinone oxidoreductase